MPARPIDSNVIFELPGVAEPAISPDGDTVAYVATRTDREALDGRSHIEALPFAGGEATRLTSGEHDRHPVWSPDGRTLAFLRREDHEVAGGPPRRVSQVWLLPLAGGEARRLTNLRAGVLGMVWSRNGSALLCVGDVDPDAPPEDADATVPRARRVNRIYYRADGLGWRGDAHRQLFRVDIESGEAVQLTRADADVSAPAASPDGETVAFFASDRSSARERLVPGRYELSLVPLAGGAVRRVARSVVGAGSIAWSPDGRRLAYTANDGEVYAQSYLWVTDADGAGEPRRVTGDEVNPILGFFPLLEPPPLTWNRRILFAADARGASGLYSATPGGRIDALRSEPELLASLSLTPDGRRAVAHTSTVRRPGELVAIDLEGGAHQLTRVSEPYLSERAVGRTERFSVRRGDVEVDCWLTFPPGFDRTRRYPLVLEVHGGPNGFFGEGWYVLHQLLASAGYLVLWTNPRGSSTYGADFVSRVFEDWGGEDYLDIMAAVDRVAARSYVDETRLGIHGYSYGGFMTSWAVGHTDRFAAAIVAAPVTNLVSMYGQTDIAVTFGEFQWGPPPWTSREVLDRYLERSPITYASEVRTPVLLLHGEADIRCPISQSEEYYVALKRLGKTVEFVRFPGGYHGFTNAGHPAIRQAYYDHVLEWCARWLRPAAAPRRRTAGGRRSQ